jgi:hypothetical protein
LKSHCKKARLIAYLNVPKNGIVTADLYRKTGTKRDTVLLDIISNLPKATPAIKEGKPINCRIFGGF